MPEVSDPSTAAGPYDVIVVGSLNADLVLTVPRRPAAGETLHAAGAAWGHGGKGANQAEAAVRAGAATAMVGAVGTDAFGPGLVDRLVDAGVACPDVVREPGPSGIAVISVTPDGENTIVVVPGANAALSAGHVRQALAGSMRPGTVVLCQLETHAAAVAAAAEASIDHGGRFVLNASPIGEDGGPDPDVVALADPLVVNRGEAAQLLTDGDDGEGGGDHDALLELATRLIARGPRSVVVTGGAEGAAFAGPDGSGVWPAPAVEVLDTTGAGDAFAGTLAARLADGATLSTAVEAAVLAGAEATTWTGARPPLS